MSFECRGRFWPTQGGEPERRRAERRTRRKAGVATNVCLVPHIGLHMKVCENDFVEVSDADESRPGS
jgi:hypothetical protein